MTLKNGSWSPNFNKHLFILHSFIKFGLYQYTGSIILCLFPQVSFVFIRSFEGVSSLIWLDCFGVSFSHERFHRKTSVIYNSSEQGNILRILSDILPAISRQVWVAMKASGNISKFSRDMKVLPTSGNPGFNVYFQLRFVKTTFSQSVGL